MWQELWNELHPKGLEIVTVAMDTAGAGAAGEFIDKAGAQHPSLIDEQHLVAELFGVVNVPSGIWIDEHGVIVRPPEPAFPGTSVFQEMIKDVPAPPDDDPNYLMRSLAVSKKIVRPDPAAYVDALRDWVARGAESPYALSPEQVIERSKPRGVDEARAAAHFELGQHLHRTGYEDAARAHFREAHRLAPRNWTYKRQAWSLVDPTQGPSEHYEGDWASDVAALGPETYYDRAGPAFD